MHGGNHEPSDLPVVLIGGGAKTASGTLWKRDRHHVFATEQRLADLHLTVLQKAFGGKDAAFGSSTGVVEALLA